MKPFARIKMSFAALRRGIFVAKRRGYDTGKFIWVRQDSMSGVK